MPESRCVKKETVDIDILVTSRGSDRKIMQNNENNKTSKPPTKEKKWNQLNLFR